MSRYLARLAARVQAGPMQPAGSPFYAPGLPYAPGRALAGWGAGGDVDSEFDSEAVSPAATAAAPGLKTSTPSADEHAWPATSSVSAGNRQQPPDVSQPPRSPQPEPSSQTARPVARPAAPGGADAPALRPGLPGAEARSSRRPTADTAALAVAAAPAPSAAAAAGRAAAPTPRPASDAPATVRGRVDDAARGHPIPARNAAADGAVPAGARTRTPPADAQAASVAAPTPASASELRRPPPSHNGPAERTAAPLPQVEVHIGNVQLTVRAAAPAAPSPPQLRQAPAPRADAKPAFSAHRHYLRAG